MFTQQDLIVRLQLASCKFGVMVSEYVDRLKWGSTCTFDDLKNLFLLDMYINILECHEIDNENSCFTDEEIDKVFQAISAITGCCFQPYNYTYTDGCYNPIARCEEGLSFDVQAPGGDVTIGFVDIDNGSTDNPTNANPGIALYELSKDGINFFSDLTYTCSDLGVQNVTLRVTNNCGASNTCTTQIFITDNLAVCP